MPELPEVEHFRTLLATTLVSLADQQKETNPIVLKRGSLDKTPPRKFIQDHEIDKINQERYFVSDVLRKGKLIAMVLKPLDHGNPLSSSQATTTTKAMTMTRQHYYLMVHMGMTGRISTPQLIPKLESLAETKEYPPPHTYLTFTCQDREAAFSDPRKFGFVQLVSTHQENPDEDTAVFGSLAMDAWKDVDETTKPDLVQKMAHQSRGIKALLLDQKRVVSGVGNWVADEVLYQTQLHPDQTHLSIEQAARLVDTLHAILDTAVDCLVHQNTDFPKDWLFHYRWSNKKAGTKDAKSRTITFVTSGGRTSAIVASLQKKTSPALSSPTTTDSKEKKAHKRKRTTSATKDATTKAAKNTVPASSVSLKREQPIPTTAKETKAETKRLAKKSPADDNVNDYRKAKKQKKATQTKATKKQNLATKTVKKEAHNQRAKKSIKMEDNESLLMTTSAVKLQSNIIMLTNEPALGEVQASHTGGIAGLTDGNPKRRTSARVRAARLKK